MRKSPLHSCRWDGDILMNHNSEYLPGSASLPTSPVAPVAPSSAVASRLARSSSDSQAEKGTSCGWSMNKMILNRHYLHSKLTTIYCTFLGFHQFLTLSLFPQAVLHSESNLSSSPLSTRRTVYWLSTLYLCTSLGLLK